MNELAWRQREKQLVEAHAAADPPLSPDIWRGVEARLAQVDRRPRGRVAWLAMAVAAVAAAVALWWLPRESRAPVVPLVAPVLPPPIVIPPPPSPPAPSVVLNQVLETTGPVTVAITADAGRLEIEPCRGRFVNITLLDSPHQRLAIVERNHRLELELDAGQVLTSGVAHILVPADTHLILTTRSGPVVVRGLGGPLEVTTDSGEVQVDTAPRKDPAAAITTITGAITWRGRCTGRCRVDARSRSGDITLRTPHQAAFASGAIRGTSESGRVVQQEIQCTDPQCLSSPLPWRQGALGVH
jgi:hypothetical protein